MTADIRPLLGHARVGEQLTTWDVRPGLADLRAVHARALNTSVIERCIALRGNAIDADRRRLEALADEAALSVWTTPELAFLYHRGLQTSRDPRLAAERVTEALRAPLGTPHPPPPQTGLVEPVAPWVHFALGVLEGDARRDGHESTLVVCAPQHPQRASFTDAMGLLDRCWPQLADAVRSLVRNVMWCRAVRGMGAVSATVPQTHGAIFVRHDATTLAIVEALAQETTHLDMLMRARIDRLVFNDDAHGASPFRRRGSPLGRTLHAAVVSARVATALQRCAEILDAHAAERAGRRAHESYRDLAVAVRTLQAGGRFTRAGDALIGTLEALVNANTVPPAA